MTKVSVREFRKNLKKYLAEEVQITSNGKVIAQTVPLQEKVASPEAPGEKIESSSSINTPVSSFKDLFFAGKKYRVCPHGQSSGECPQGCVE